MPRIRSLKPEHKQHRKVGLLNDRQYRLWVSMVTEADDDGRLVADAAQLRALTFAYHPEVTTEMVADDLVVIEQTGMVHLYRVGDTCYAHFPSWTDHQRIDRPQASKLPCAPCCSRRRPSARLQKNHRKVTGLASTNGRESSASDREHSTGIGGEGIGGEGIGGDQGSEGKGVVEGADAAAAATDPRTRNGIPIPPKILERIPELKSWPSPEALLALWNFHASEAGLPAAETLSDKRRAKAAPLLRQFSDWRWWNGTLSGIKRSAFLCGKVPPTNGHSKPFRADFDWVLSTKDGVENIVRLHDGKYT